MNIHAKRQIGIKFSEWLIESMNQYCRGQDIKRTSYIESLIRADLKRKKALNEPVMQVVNTWGDDLEEMPLNLQYREAP